MALLDTLKKSLSSAASYVTAPITAPFKAAKSSFDATMNMAKNAAASRPTTPASPATTPTTLGAYNPTSQQSGSLAVTVTGPVPTNVSSGVTTKSNSAYVAPQVSKIPAGTTQPQTTTAPAPAPVQNTQSSGYNNMGIGTFQQSNDPAVQALIRSTNATMGGNTTTTPTATTPTPATTSIAPTDNGLSELEKKLLGTYEVSAEERALRAEQEVIDRQAAELRAGINSGLTKIEGQPITLGLLRGQQAMLGRQGNDALDALTGSQNTLENRLKTLASDRGLANEAAQKEYAMASARAKGSEPIEVGGSLIQLNPATGKYEVVYQAPTKAEDGGFTLGEGQMRYDANGNLVAIGAPKSTTASGEKIIMQGGNPYTMQNGILVPVPMSGTTNANQAKISTIDTLLNAADDVLNHPGLSSRVGWQGGIPAIPGTQGADFDNRLEFMKSQFERMGVDLLRGLGAMSEGERQAMTKSLSTISRTQSEAEFKNELSRIKEQFSKQKGILQQGGSMGSSVTPQALAERGVPQNVIDTALANGYSPEEIASDYGITFNNASNSALNSSIGGLSAKYESGGNPGAIGHDSTGGYSYGTYQLAHNNAQRFVAESPYAGQFAGIPFNSAQFQQKWREIAQKDPQGFASAQHAYIAKTHLDPVVSRIKNMGVDFNSLSPVAKDVIWSTAVQHGPGNKIIEQALATASDERDFINKVYQLRWSNGSGFASSTPAVKQSVYNRFFGPSGELAQALSQIA